MILTIKSNGGGEFTLGKLPSKQYKYVLSSQKKYDDANYVDNTFWESDILSLPWSEYDDILHLNGAYGTDWYITDNRENIIIDSEDQALGKYSIDFENDDRLEFSDDNRKVTVGWNNINTGFSKGYMTLKKKDFSEGEIRCMTNNNNIPYAMIGTLSFEKGSFFEIEVPDNFDKTKLIITIAKFRFVCNDDICPISYISNIIYDGEILDKEFLGDTDVKELKHFTLEPKISGMNVEFNYSSEFYDKY